MSSMLRTIRRSKDWNGTPFISKAKAAEEAKRLEAGTVLRDAEAAASRGSELSKADAAALRAESARILIHQAFRGNRVRMARRGS